MRRIRHVGRYSKEEREMGGCLIKVYFILFILFLAICNYGFIGAILFCVLYVVLFSFAIPFLFKMFDIIDELFGRK